MFKKIKELLDTTPQADRPSFLRESEVNALARLKAEDGWAVLIKLTERRVTLLGEEMLTTPDIDRVLHLRGQVLGLREAVTLVDKTLKAGEDFNAYRSRRNIDGADRDRRAVLATYGTEFWSA